MCTSYVVTDYVATLVGVVVFNVLHAIHGLARSSAVIAAVSALHVADILSYGILCQGV